MAYASTIALDTDGAAADGAVHGLLLIDGEWREPASGRRLDVFNPATESRIGTAAAGGAADIDLAVRAARVALTKGPWSRMPPAERGRILSRVADLIEERAEALAHGDVRENGMPLAVAQWSVATGIAVFRYYAGWVTKITGDTHQLADDANSHCYTIREPIGVVGQIIPWNGPLMMACQKLAPALAAGCTCVMKPAEDTPLNALRIGQLLLDAGVPAGVVNIVTGFGHEAGAALAAHPGIDKVSFTGSTATGREIVKAAAGNLKRVSLELGGKSPVIVLADADLGPTVAGVLGGIMMNSGQVCIAGSRLYVQRAIYDRLLDELGTAAQAMKLGDGFAADTQLGPLISAKQMDRVLGFVENGIGSGARLVTGGGRVGDVGHFVAPTILANVDKDARVMREEIFGPVLASTPFDDLDEAVALANDTEYGLAGAIYTRDLGNAHRLSKRIKGGNIFVNTHGTYDPGVPFGGFRQSGWGRELGKEGLDSYLETKSVFMAL